MGALVPVAHIGSSVARRAIDEAGSPVSPALPAAMDVLADAYLGLAALVFVALIWRAVRQSNRSLESNAMRGSACFAQRPGATRVTRHACVGCHGTLAVSPAFPDTGRASCRERG